MFKLLRPAVLRRYGFRLERPGKMVDTLFELGRKILVISHPSKDHFLIIRPAALKGLSDFVEHSAFAKRIASDKIVQFFVSDELLETL